MSPGTQGKLPDFQTAASRKPASLAHANRTRDRVIKFAHQPAVRDLRIGQRLCVVVYQRVRNAVLFEALVPVRRIVFGDARGDRCVDLPAVLHA